MYENTLRRREDGGLDTHSFLYLQESETKHQVHGYRKRWVAWKGKNGNSEQQTETRRNSGILNFIFIEEIMDLT